MIEEDKAIKAHQDLIHDLAVLRSLSDTYSKIESEADKDEIKISIDSAPYLVFKVKDAKEIMEDLFKKVSGRIYGEGLKGRKEGHPLGKLVLKDFGPGSFGDFKCGVVSKDQDPD